MSSTAAYPLLSTAAGIRSASGLVAKAVGGFHVFRIDSFSLTKYLLGGERISSQPFAAGHRSWKLDCYPHGTDASKDSSSSSDSAGVSLYLRLHGVRERVRAQFRFSLLDAAGKPAYALPAETAVFRDGHLYGDHDLPKLAGEKGTCVVCGYAKFIGWEELERRRDSLLPGDRLAIPCDVAVVQMDEIEVGPTDVDYSDKDDDASSSNNRERTKPWWWPRRHNCSDDEYLRRCLPQH